VREQGKGGAAARSVGPVREFNHRNLVFSQEEGEPGHANQRTEGTLLENRVGWCLLDEAKARRHLTERTHRHRGTGSANETGHHSLAAVVGFKQSHGTLPRVSSLLN